jgi:hypothetical protein
MSKLTRCKNPRTSRNFLAPGTTLRITLFIITLFVFGLAHIHLQFRITRMNNEMVPLQDQQQLLLSSINELRHGNEVLKNPSRLYDYAIEELRLQPCAPDRREAMQMDRDTYMRYVLHRRKPDPDRDSHKQLAWVQNLGEQLGWVSRAEAGD